MSAGRDELLVMPCAPNALEATLAKKMVAAVTKDALDAASGST